MSIDKIKSKGYFESYITKHEQMLNKLLEGLKNVDEDKDKARRHISAIAIERYKLIKAKYSCGCELKGVYEQFCDLLEDMSRFWEKDGRDGRVNLLSENT